MPDTSYFDGHNLQKYNKWSHDQIDQNTHTVVPISKTIIEIMQVQEYQQELKKCKILP